MVAQITIAAADVGTLISSGFTKLEIAKITESGTYTIITSNTASSATLSTAPASTLYRMGGTTVGFSVNEGDEQLITFSAVLEYWTPTQVANRINEVIPGLATVSANKVVLTSPTTGRGSTLETTYSTAPDLGLTVGFKSLGLDASINLVGGTYVYNYVDVAGAVGDKYKWRFTNGGVAPISSLYGPIEGGEQIVSGVDVSIATAYFVGLDGRPKPTSVIIVSDRPPTIVGSVAVGDDHARVYSSDANGFLQIPLVQGTVIRVAIEGTAYVREITVPNTGTFDLLAAMSTAPDPFTVQAPPPYLIRRSI